MKGKKLFIGKSASYMISSILLLRGYNIAIPEVDTGIDIVAIDPKANNQFSIQLKSSQAPRESKGNVNKAILIQKKFIEEKITNFVIFSIYMPAVYGITGSHSRWWNIIFSWEDLNLLCSGHAPIGSTTKKQKDQISIYFTYDLKEKRLFATRPALRSSSNHKQDLSKYCDALDENIWEKSFPSLI